LCFVVVPVWLPVVAEVNGCELNPCQSIQGSDNVCTDLIAPATGFSCGCTSGLAWNGQACTGNTMPLIDAASLGSEP
jgi:hypothetical protein